MNTSDPIALLLEGRYPDPDAGSFLRVPTRSVLIAYTLDGMEAEAVSALDLGRHLAVVSDATTHGVLGARVERALRSVARIESVVLSAHPHADLDTVERVRAAGAQADAYIAVGSGTLNDLCKYASALDSKPYAVFGTAPSMNGYTSANAAITVHGHKKSLPARMPAGVFLDLRVLAQAPPRMIRSGLGDSLCRPTAQSDWLLAHLLLERPYREAPFALLAADEESLFGEPLALLSGDLEVMRRLARTLVLSGFGMTLCGSSHPASQGEHLISHYIDMTSPPERGEFFHGEQVGVATLTMATLQERMLAGPAPQLRPTAIRRDEVLAHFGAEVGAECWNELEGKRLTADAAQSLSERLAARWDEIGARVAAIARPAEALRQVLVRAGAPVSPSDIGVRAERYREAVLHARELRDRYTFLDLAGDAGMLEAFALG
jgi:glycerol-1-phosphate dehydrogenase [NAD(P)+]